jgi:hypothetical protein
MSIARAELEHFVKHGIYVLLGLEKVLTLWQWSTDLNIEQSGVAGKLITSQTVFKCLYRL